MFIKKFAAIVAVCVLAAPSIAQEESKIEATAPVAASVPAKVEVMLSEEGKLEGKAFIAETKEAAKKAKVTLTAEGKVVDAVVTDEEGNFSFANVAPGAYQMLGSADGFVGSQSYDVVPFASPAVGSPCSLGMCGQTSDAVYDNYASQPVSSFSSSCGNTCGGGAGGGRLGGRLGGGLLSNGRIGLIGLAGLAGLGGDDSSPDR